MKYEIQDCIGAKMRKISRIIDNCYRKNLAEFEVTENQLTILMVLYKTKMIEQGQVGKILELERSTVSRNIKLLEKKNLILRTNDYKPSIELTKKGHNLVETILPKWEKTMDEIHNLIGDKGFQQISDLENVLK